MRTDNEKEAANVLDRKEKLNSSAETRGSRRRGIMLLSLVLTIVILSSLTVYAVINYVNSSAPPVEDTFTPATVSCGISKNGNVYTVTNTSNVPVYARVYVDADWVDGEGYIHWTTPSVNVTASGWTKRGDFYSYNTPVAAGGTVQITVAAGGDSAPSGYSFKANVSAEVIQSNPKSAALDAWGYNFG